MMEGAPQQTSIGEPILTGYSTADGWGQFEQQAVANCKCGCGEKVDPRRNSLFIDDAHYRKFRSPAEKEKRLAERRRLRARLTCRCGCGKKLDPDGRSFYLNKDHKRRSDSKAAKQRRANRKLDISPERGT